MVITNGLVVEPLKANVCCNWDYLLFTALFYFLLGNVHPMFRSKARHIQLVAVVKSEYLKKYGAQSILKQVVDDIKKLVCYPFYLLLLVTSANHVLRSADTHSMLVGSL